MPKLTLASVRARCAEGRFLPYSGRNDRLFAPPAVFLVWVFAGAGWSGNAVSLLSGLVVAIGAVMLASSNPLTVFVGSFGYVTFFFLDYVDGGVARIRKEAGMGGQYIDWLMHVVAAVGTAAGLFAGALSMTGPWIIPFGVLAVIAAALTLDRYALAWFSIVMQYQGHRAAGNLAEPRQPVLGPAVYGPVFRFLRNVSTVLFHESFAIYLLPALALAQLLLPGRTVDFRVALTILGGALYFPVILFDMWVLATTGRVDNAYKKLFFGDHPARLPDDHFLG